MTANEQIGLSTNPSDPTLLRRISLVQFACLGIAALIAAAILAAWLVHGVGAWFPDGWYLMKFNTGVCMLLSAVGLGLLSGKPAAIRLWSGRTMATIVFLLAAVALYEHLSGRLSGLDVMLAADPTSNKPGLMSTQTSIFLLLMSISLLLASVHQERLRAPVAVLTALLVLHTLIILSGYCSSAVQLFGQSMAIRTSPHTLTCMLLLAIGMVAWRTQSGSFALLAGQGLGSQLARRILPCALLLPLVLMLCGTTMTHAGWLSPTVAVGLTIAVIAAAFSAVVALAGQRINRMERDLRELSLTDELTGVLNYRGFVLLGEQSFREAQRSNAMLTLLVFDIENAKEISESMGHGVALRLMRDMAEILRKNFDPADIVARTESDEFAVITKDENAGGVIALMRVGERVEAINNVPDRAYPIHFSVGEATSDPASGESFQQLVERAGLMRRQRKRAEQVLGG